MVLKVKNYGIDPISIPTINLVTLIIGFNFSIRNICGELYISIVGDVTARRWAGGMVELSSKTLKQGGDKMLGCNKIA